MRFSCGDDHAWTWIETLPIFIGEREMYGSGRYVLAAEWEDDPGKVTAEIADYLVNITLPLQPSAPIKPPCTMAITQIAAKLPKAVNAQPSKMPPA